MDIFIAGWKMTHRLLITHHHKLKTARKILQELYICASEVSLARTRERGVGVPLPLAASLLARAFLRDFSLAQIGELARRLLFCFIVWFALAKPEWKTASAKLSCSLQLKLFSKTNECIGKKKLLKIFIYAMAPVLTLKFLSFLAYRKYMIGSV